MDPEDKRFIESDPPAPYLEQLMYEGLSEEEAEEVLRQQQPIRTSEDESNDIPF